jgi:hypothetical protein
LSDRCSESTIATAARWVRFALSLLFANHGPATLEQLQKRLGVFFRRLRSLAGETRRATSLALAGGYGHEFHHLERHLIGIAHGGSSVGTIFRHQSFILDWYGVLVSIGMVF